MRFTIFTHVEHNLKDDNYIAYAPYVREMNIWIDKFEKVEIVAPLSKGPLSYVSLPYKHSNIKFTKVSYFDFLSLKTSFKALLSLPVISCVIFKSMCESDHIHIRNPGNIGLIASIIQIVFPRKKKTAKYAGNWDPRAKQPWSYNLQKWILKNQYLTRNCKVLVYGDWADQNSNILPFFTASFKEDRLKETIVKDFRTPHHFVFVGSFVDGKRPKFAILLIEELNRRGFPCKLSLYGDGNLKKDLVFESRKSKYLEVKGSVSIEDLEEVYKSSQFLILASRSEGWPKAVAEAMAFGCIPIATSVSCVPYMLNNGERGILIEPELDKAVLSVISYLKDEKKLNDVSKRAITWSRQFTLEKFEKEITSLL